MGICFDLPIFRLLILMDYCVDNISILSASLLVGWTDAKLVVFCTSLPNWSIQSAKDKLWQENVIQMEVMLTRKMGVGLQLINHVKKFCWGIWYGLVSMDHHGGLHRCESYLFIHFLQCVMLDPRFSLLWLYFLWKLSARFRRLYGRFLMIVL